MPAMHDFLFRAVLLLVPMILSLTVHEYAHAFVADRLGDDTPRLQGRLTLDPRPHIHPLGTLLLPLRILAFGSSTFFAWARPVQVNPLRVRRTLTMATGQLLIALAGPRANLLLVLLTVAVFVTGQTLTGGSLPAEAAFALGSLAWVNVVLAVFNMLPVPPLDGSRLLFWLLPASWARLEQALTTAAPVVLMVLILQGSWLLGPLLELAVAGLDLLTGGHTSVLIQGMLSRTAPST